MRLVRRLLPLLAELMAQLVIGFGISAFLGVVWGVLDGTRLLTHIGHVATIAGGLWLLGGSSVLGKVTMMEYMQFGVRVRTEDLVASDYSDIETVRLTPFGSSLIVGTLLIVVGVILL